MRFKEKYQKEIVPKLKEVLDRKNSLEIPKLEKIVVNVGLNSNSKGSGIEELALKTLEVITGQKPVLTKAKKAISGFKIREGMVVGAKVTLRGQRMYDFVEKLISITLPRVRDFRGLKTSIIDKTGNISIGFKEHLVFSEVNQDDIDRIHGLEVVIATTAKTHDEGLALFRLMGFPFIEDKKEDKK